MAAATLAVKWRHAFMPNNYLYDYRTRIEIQWQNYWHYDQVQQQSVKENTQTIRNLEGNTAYIKVGNAYPI